jgi:sulfate adenylyltransferase subunit 1
MNTSALRGHARPLRFITCGSVDDGKSTLIGRLLYDSKALMVDQLESLAVSTQKRARGARSQSGKLDLSLVTDGLEAEREQGITIDVAYRYFATPKRKFIIADAPGHEQYTRNMVTGASKSDVAVLLIDVMKLDFTQATLTLLPQTKRHAALAGLLGLQHIVVAVNKMDAIDFDAAKFERVVIAFAELAASLSIHAFTAIPMSALDGDGVVAHTERTSWFQGPALLPHLESLELTDARGCTTAHIAVQWVTRDEADDHLRWVTGDLAEAALSVSDTISVFPSGATAVVAAIRTGRGLVDSAKPGEAVAVRFDRQVDVARGDWIIASTVHHEVVVGAPDTPAQFRQRTTATIAWLDSAPLTVGRRYVVRHGARWLPARVSNISARLDLTSGQWRDADSPGPHAEVNANDLVRAEIEFAQALPLAAFASSTALGAFVMVDPGTNATAAAGMIS